MSITKVIKRFYPLLNMAKRDVCVFVSPFCLLLLSPPFPLPRDPLPCFFRLAGALPPPLAGIVLRIRCSSRLLMIFFCSSTSTLAIRSISSFACVSCCSFCCLSFATSAAWSQPSACFGGTAFGSPRMLCKVLLTSCGCVCCTCCCCCGWWWWCCC